MNWDNVLCGFICFDTFDVVHQPYRYRLAKMVAKTDDLIQYSTKYQAEDVEDEDNDKNRGKQQYWWI